VLLAFIITTSSLSLQRRVRGLIVGWLPALGDDCALWHVQHTDGDVEDLELHEVGLLHDCSSSDASCVMPCYVSFHVMPCYVMLWYVMLCYVILCHIMLCYVLLYYTILCHAMLCIRNLGIDITAVYNTHSDGSIVKNQ
jgi:hypothetical protein